MKIIAINYINEDYPDEVMVEHYRFDDDKKFDFDKFYKEVEEEYQKEIDKDVDSVGVEWSDIVERKEKEYGLIKDNTIVDTYEYFY